MKMTIVKVREEYYEVEADSAQEGFSIIEVYARDPDRVVEYQKVFTSIAPERKQ